MPKTEFRVILGSAHRKLPEEKNYFFGGYISRLQKITVKLQIQNKKINY